MTNKTNKLILVRGASGSGKSTFARKLASTMENVVVYEADDFFMFNGVYTFDPRKLGYAHKSNQTRTREALNAGVNVIVANTMTKLTEIRDYTSIAEDLGVPVEVYRSVGMFENVHSVPSEVVTAMRNRMVDFPGEKIINAPE